MNPFLKKLGFAATDRVLITHIDDMGFCHAAKMASEACLASGASSCASIIVNAPWFREAAEICLEHSEFDVGVHLREIGFALDQPQRLDRIVLVRHLPVCPVGFLALLVGDFERGISRKAA